MGARPKIGILPDSDLQNPWFQKWASISSTRYGRDRLKLEWFQEEIIYFPVASKVTSSSVKPAKKLRKYKEDDSAEYGRAVEATVAADSTLPHRD